MYKLKKNPTYLISVAGFDMCIFLVCVMILWFLKSLELYIVSRSYTIDNCHAPTYSQYLNTYTYNTLREAENVVQQKSHIGHPRH